MSFYKSHGKPWKKIISVFLSFAIVLGSVSVSFKNPFEALAASPDLNVDKEHNLADGAVVVSGSGVHRITGSLTGANTHGITIQNGFDGIVILNGVNVSTNSAINNYKAPAALIVEGSGKNNDISTKVLFLLNGTNTLHSGYNGGTNAAGLEVWRGAQITVDSYNAYIAPETENTTAHHLSDKLDVFTAQDRELDGGRAAGIGAGDRPYSGGHMIFRGGTTVATSGYHGAGIGDAHGYHMKPQNIPNTPPTKPGIVNGTTANGSGDSGWLWSGTIIIYGQAHVDSKGGGHGAGIGGGCYASNTWGPSDRPNKESMIIALPAGSTTAASASSTMPKLGAVKELVYFGDEDEPEIIVRTEDNRTDVNMYIDLTSINGVGNRIDMLIPDSEAEAKYNLYANKAQFGNTGSLGLVKQHGVVNGRVSFYTDAVTPRGHEYVAQFREGLPAINDPNHLQPGFEREIILPVPAFVLKVLNDSNGDDLFEGFPDQTGKSTNARFEIENVGSADIIPVEFHYEGDVEFFDIKEEHKRIDKLESNEIKAINIPLKTTTPERATPYTLTVTSYGNKVRPEELPPDFDISQKVTKRGVTATVTPSVSVTGKDAFEVTVVFNEAVENFAPGKIDVKNGDYVTGSLVSVGSPSPAGSNFYKEWKFQVLPKGNLITNDIIEITILPDAARDEYNQPNQKSDTEFVSYTEAGPSGKFGFTEKQKFVTPQSSFTIDFIPRGSAGPDKDTIYVRNATSPMAENDIQSGDIQVFEGTSTTGLNVTYSVSGNRITVSAPTGSPFKNNTYKVKIAPDVFRNNIRNYVPLTESSFEVRVPALIKEPGANGPSGANDNLNLHVTPWSLEYVGGTIQVSLHGENFQHAKDGQLWITLPSNLTGGAPKDVPIPKANISQDGTRGFISVDLPLNINPLPEEYIFNGYILDDPDFVSPVKTSADSAMAVVKEAAPGSVAMKANKAEVPFSGEDIILTVSGVNLNNLSGLEVRVSVDKGLPSGAVNPIGIVPVTSTGLVTIPLDYSILLNTTNDGLLWSFELVEAGSPNIVLATALVKQKPAVPQVEKLSVSKGYTGELTQTLTLDYTGGEIFFTIDGLNLNNFTPFQVKDGKTNEIAGNNFDLTGIHNTQGKTPALEGFILPPNISQQNQTYEFVLYNTKDGNLVATAHKVKVVVEKPSSGVTSNTATPDKFTGVGTASVSTFDLTGLHMDAATLELRQQNGSIGHTFTPSEITNSGENASTTLTFPPYKGGPRNDIYLMEAFFGDVATGLVAPVEIGPSDPSVTGLVANPNYYPNVESTYNGRGRSVLTVNGHYLENFKLVQIYDKIFDRFYTVDITGKDMTATYTVTVPSAVGVFEYEIYTDGNPTGHTAKIAVGVALGQSGPNETGEIDTNAGNDAFKKEEFVGYGGGSKGGGFSGNYPTHFDILNYQSQRAGLNDPKNPRIVLSNTAYMSREQFDLAAAGAKEGARKASKMGGGHLTVEFDTTVAGDTTALEGRMYVEVNQPVPGIYTGVFTRPDRVEKTKKLFEQKFDNETMRFVNLSHKGPLGVTVEIAANLDFKIRNNTVELYFYSFNPETGDFQQIKNPKDYFDTAGYLHFSINQGGDVVITDKPLSRDGKVISSGNFPVAEEK